MANQIKKGGGDDELRLQITEPARSSGLVSEGGDGEAARLASVHVYGFDGLLLVVDDSVAMRHRAELVSSAASDTESVHGGRTASVALAGNGYQVNLPGASAAGFSVGDKAPVVAADGLLAIHAAGGARVATDLATLRREQ